MSQLTFRCPKTCNYIRAGVETDEKSLARIWDRSMRVYCPYCKEMHELPVREAELEDAA
jgi:phage FluMu protein Com